MDPNVPLLTSSKAYARTVFITSSLLLELEFRVVVCLLQFPPVASGIPDFRSASGLYRNLNKYPVPFLTDPSTIFSFRDFADFPIPFWILAKEMFYTNDQYHPTPAHFFLALLQKKGLLRRVYTQNIDGLDRSAGLTLPVLVEGHGTCSSCACIRCHKPYSPSIPQEAVNERRIPVCGSCGGLIKPDIVFFGEDLPDRFYSCVAEDCYQTDLVLVMGTSLQVHPMWYVLSVSSN